MRRPLWNAGFFSLLATQFFAAASDNILKQALTFAVALGGPWAGHLGAGGQGWVAIAFTVPFIVLSAFGGRMADRYSKRTMTIALKIASIGVALFTVFAFHADSAALAVTALVFFAVVSSFFGPVKYGMIAELVDRDQVGRANGIINLATNIAVISGLIIGGVVAERFRLAHEGGPSIGFWLPGSVMLAFVLGGFVTCLTLPKLTPQKPDLPLDPNPFSTYWESLRSMARGPLLVVALAWTFFYFLAAVVLLVIADYRGLLGITETQSGLMAAAMAVSIGVGSIIAAWSSGAAPRPMLVPFGAAGLAFFFLLLGLGPRNPWLVGALLSGMGLVAGFYIIPLQSMLQLFAPDAERGRFLGTANAMSFVMGGVGSLLFMMVVRLGWPSDKAFLVLAAATVVVGLLLARWLRHLRLPDASATLAASPETAATTAQATTQDAPR
jgi:acyl-[acyl-carrier-protein]-phospholipid O-acyltransferase/long-chain-fatty-acid--[acyl-carrier-protein] ligase